LFIEKLRKGTKKTPMQNAVKLKTLRPFYKRRRALIYKNYLFIP
jgi:hypothetical protein